MSRLVSLLLVVGSLVSCGDGGTGSDDGPPLVVATTTILGDVVASIVGEDAVVEVLIPVGADPHDYQASAAQIAELNSASLVVANGLGLEEGLEDTLEAAESDGVPVLEVGPLLDPLPLQSPGSHDQGDEEAAGGFDPHVWLDPLRMAEAAGLIAGRLAEIDAGTDWEGRAEAYAAELARVDEQIFEELSIIPEEERLLVSNHQSLGYFANRYGFEVVGVVIPGGSTLADPSSAQLAELVETMRREGVLAIFAETTEPGALAEAVAAELGDDVEVVRLFTESLGEPGSGAATLVGMLRTNAGLITDALAPGR